MLFQACVCSDTGRVRVEADGYANQHDGLRLMPPPTAPSSAAEAAAMALRKGPSAAPAGDVLAAQVAGGMRLSLSQQVRRRSSGHSLQRSTHHHIRNASHAALWCCRMSGGLQQQRRQTGETGCRERPGAEGRRRTRDCQARQSRISLGTLTIHATRTRRWTATRTLTTTLMYNNGAPPRAPRHH